MATLTCSIIVPVFRGGEVFETCLRSASAALRPGDELVVVADGEGDGSWRLAEQYGGRVVHNPVNGGPSKARNLGARSAQGDILYFIDADVLIPSHATATIEKIFSTEPEFAALIGSYDEAPGDQSFLSQFKNLFHHFVHQQGTKEASTFWGACGAIRREVFLEMGGFSESYERPCIEDIELGYRLRAASHRIRLAPDLQVKHMKRWGTNNLIKTDIFDRAAPWTELIWEYTIRRKHPEGNDLNLGVSYKLSLVTSFLLVASAFGCLITPWCLIPMGLLGILFLSLQLPLLQFFRRKRGRKFALKAIPWRFAYDLYSGVGFCYGSLRFAQSTTRKVLSQAFAKVDPIALGLAVGSAWALILGGATLALVLRGGEEIGPNLSLLSQVYPGYAVTYAGSLIGALYGLLSGFVVGTSIAAIRNTILRFYLGSIKIRAFLTRLDHAA